MAYGEFLSDGGDIQNVSWCSNRECSEGRGTRTVTTINLMFQNGIHVLGTQENDHPEWILQKLQDMLSDLYPNIAAPSDHPPCYATITFNNL